MTTNSAGTVYIETSVVSYLTARSPRELMAAAWQAATVDWWDNHRNRFQLFTSELTFQEASRGDKEASARRLAALDDVTILQVNSIMRQFADVIVQERVLPASAWIDAAHIAVCAISGIDYLPTWNFHHLTNVQTRNLVHALCEQHGYTSPQICTPFELMSLSGEINNG